MMNLEGRNPKVSFSKDQCKAEQHTAKDFVNSPIMISKNAQMIDVIEKLTELGD